MVGERLIIGKIRTLKNILDKVLNKRGEKKEIKEARA
jgi:hypothetical protein